MTLLDALNDQRNGGAHPTLFETWKGHPGAVIQRHADTGLVTVTADGVEIEGLAGLSTAFRYPDPDDTFEQDITAARRGASPNPPDPGQPVEAYVGVWLAITRPEPSDPWFTWIDERYRH